jgi:hypothetical protein
MRNHLLVAGVAAAALFPTFALAQTSCEQQHENRVAGTLGGGAIGALIGSAVAGHGDKTTGAIIGGVGGAVIGNQATKGSADCAHAYGYYDSRGAWHANAVARTEARGYYDREGRWIEGAPNGAYDSRGTWVPATSQGHYDSHGGWTPAQTTGYWDTRGQWVAPQPAAYDRAGAYDRGDNRAYRDNRAYADQAPWGGGADFRTRAAWLGQKIQRSVADGSLSRAEGRRAERSLRNLQHQERRMRHYHGQLRAGDEATMQARLDSLRQNVRWTRQDNQRND